MPISWWRKKCKNWNRIHETNQKTVKLDRRITAKIERTITSNAFCFVVTIHKGIWIWNHDLQNLEISYQIRAWFLYMLFTLEYLQKRGLPWLSWHRHGKNFIYLFIHPPLCTPSEQISIKKKKREWNERLRIISFIFDNIFMK